MTTYRADSPREPTAIRAPERLGRALRFARFRRVVRHLDRAVEFYCEALGFELETAAFAAMPLGGLGAERCVTLRLGDESIDLVGPPMEGVTADDSRRWLPSCSLQFQHIAIVARDMSKAFSRLQRFAPRLISDDGPIRLPASAGGVSAVKFFDPDGHPLELIFFPPGSGNPKWQQGHCPDITLGIDHSAIVVSDVTQSLAFYCGGLGFEVMSRQVNEGPSQERLDGLSGAVVEVVGLRPSKCSTPHLELLAYRQPVAWRATGHGSDQDIESDRLSWIADELNTMLPASHEVRHRAATDGGSAPGLEQLALLDPDGHAHVLLGVRPPTKQQKQIFSKGVQPWVSRS